MSRSKQRNYSENPAKKIIKLSGKSGQFEYYDKEKEANIALDYPVSFLALDILATITGFSDQHQSQYYSNEVHSTTKEQLIVKVFNHGEVASGLYKEMNLPKGAKFTTVVYAMMYNDDNEPEIVKFLFVGASLSAWIDFLAAKKLKGNAIYDYAITIEKSIPAKKGNTDYFIPEFDIKEVSDESMEKAEELDETLQEYLEQFNSVKPDSGTQKSELPDNDGITVEEQPSAREQDDGVPF